VFAGSEDPTVPDVTTRSTLKQYRHSTAVTDLKHFEHRGHSLTIDSGWQEITDATLQWLAEQRLGPTSSPSSTV
jgi:esterase/lipase